MSICRPLLLTTCALALVALTGCPTDPDSGFGLSTPAAGIRGVICAPDGVNEVHRAGVMLYADADEDGVQDDFDMLASAMTDIDGEFLLEDVGGGSYVAIARKGHRQFDFPVVSSGGIQQRLDRECFPGDSARVAVLPGTCDTPETIWSSRGFSVDVLGEDDLGLLTNPAQLAGWDIVMAPCGMSDEWLPQAETVQETFEPWLEDGGSLYVSGDAWPLIEAIDEDYLDWVGDDEDPTAANVGFGTTVAGTITDPDLAAAFGTAEIVLSDNWSMVLERGENWNPLVTSTVQTTDGVFYEGADLAVSFMPSPTSQIVYTSFGTQNATDDMKALLAEWLTGL